MFCSIHASFVLLASRGRRKRERQGNAKVILNAIGKLNIILLGVSIIVIGSWHGMGTMTLKEILNDLKEEIKQGLGNFNWPIW